MMGLGTTRNNPDYYAIEVFNEAFGGGFSSRLLRNIRMRRSCVLCWRRVGTRSRPSWHGQLAMAQRSGPRSNPIQALYAQIDDWRKNPISQEEIQRAKDTILNSFVFNFDSRQSPARAYGLRFYGYPPDFLERYRAGIESERRRRGAGGGKKSAQRPALVLVVGNTAEFDKPLSSLAR